METMLQVLPIIVYFLLIALIIVVIVLGIKLIITMNKVNDVVDDINNKVKSLNGIFSIIDYATDGLSTLTDTVVNFLTEKVFKIFKTDKDKKEKIKK
ncbi:MAG: hypothetical protein RSB41_02205 [Bacilli bacterium]